MQRCKNSYRSKLHLFSANFNWRDVCLVDHNRLRERNLAQYIPPRGAGRVWCRQTRSSWCCRCSYLKTLRSRAFGRLHPWKFFAAQAGWWTTVYSILFLVEKQPYVAASCLLHAVFTWDAISPVSWYCPVGASQGMPLRHAPFIL